MNERKCEAMPIQYLIVFAQQVSIISKHECEILFII